MVICSAMIGSRPTSMPKRMTRVFRRTSGGPNAFSASETIARAKKQSEYTPRMLFAVSLPPAVRSSSHETGYDPPAASSATADTPARLAASRPIVHLSQGTRRSSAECAGKIAKKAYATAGSGTFMSAQKASVAPRQACGMRNSKSPMGASAMKPPSMSARSHARVSCGRCNSTETATARNGSG